MEIDLWIDEDRLEEFEEWFERNNPASAKFEVLSFRHIGSTKAVEYQVRATLRSEAAVAALQRDWPSDLEN